MKVVVLTGPESTGKSWLADRLRRRFGGLLVDEYVRHYIERTQRDTTLADIPAIARGQLAGRRRTGRRTASADPRHPSAEQHALEPHAVRRLPRLAGSRAAGARIPPAPVARPQAPSGMRTASAASRI